MLTLTSMLAQGIPVKFPDLNFVFLEAGLSWVLYMMFRLNKEVSIRKREAPLLERQPEEYVRESCYFGSQPMGEPTTPAHIQQIIEMVGPESIAFATDYPHWDFDHPSALTDHLRHVSGPKRQQILSGTPAEAFGLDI